MSNFFDRTPTSSLLFFRSYSRWTGTQRESWNAVVDRCVDGLVALGKLTEDERYLIYTQMSQGHAMPSGRWMWCGGTPWAAMAENYTGTYNCSSTEVDSWEAFGYMMGLAAQGCGTGAVLEPKNIDKLPIIRTQLNIKIVGEIGTKKPKDRADFTRVRWESDGFRLTVGDSRQGWVDSYVKLLELASCNRKSPINILVDLSNIRQAGEILQGFGGVANPVKLPKLYGKIAKILNQAIGRKLTAVECCLLIDEAAIVIVAGSIRRSAGIKQFTSNDLEAATAKDNLWQQDSDGKWHIDPDRDALRMSNHTRVYHTKPTLTECTEAVRKQYYSGEGAIMWAGEAVARANADLLNDEVKKQNFLHSYNLDPLNAKCYLANMMGLFQDIETIADSVDLELNYRMGIYGLNPCLVAGTMVVTRSGHKPIESLVGKAVTIWDGKQWVKTASFRITGTNEPVSTITLLNGDTITATPAHKFILTNGLMLQLDELEIGQVLRRHSIGEIQPSKVKIEPRLASDYQIVSIKDAGIADKVYCCTIDTTHQFALSCGVMTGNCGEILLSNNLCNLSEVHLNTIAPLNLDAQSSAFKAASISAAALLHHQFTIDRYQYGREIDPIVGVSFTGLFDFFVNLFGVEWLRWWEAGRPKQWGANECLHKKHYLGPLVESGFIRQTWFDYQSDMFEAIEEEYLCYWKKIVTDTVGEYCDRHGLKRPNRCTTCQPAGSKSLLTGASPGWAPPKAARYIRRMTFDRNNPIALAAIDYGYSVIPAQSDKDELGNLLDDPFDPRCTEWLVEVPCETSWADLDGADAIDISQFSALAQYSFYMQVQKYYTGHNTSATIELREAEIEPLATAIYDSIQADDGFISAALLARFDSLVTFPRLPFEPIDKATYERLVSEVSDRRVADDFYAALAKYDTGLSAESGPAACDSDKCLTPESKH